MINVRLLPKRSFVFVMTGSVVTKGMVDQAVGAMARIRDVEIATSGSRHALAATSCGCACPPPIPSPLQVFASNCFTGTFDIVARLESFFRNFARSS